MLEFLFGEANATSLTAIYIMGLIFVILVLFISIDDLIWDIYYGLGKLFGKIKSPIIDAEEVDDKIPRKLAVMVAAYNEENVLGEVIRNVILSNQYPKSMYDIFLGVYPNDPGTQRVADDLAREFTNVHKVIHVLEGPSSKADNLNNVIRFIFEYEKEHFIRYHGFVVHDAEDLVHPYEFKLENYLLDSHGAIQIPVFPLQEKPRLGNIFRNMVSGTYGDEFAENHYRIMTARSATNAFVPSAGTGLIIRRDLIDTFPDHEVFPVGSLTEDYKLSLQFKQKGYHLHYVLDEVARMGCDGKMRREFISTRSMFPSTYRTAIRQKTRWIYGITMQTFKLGEILKLKTLSFVSKYSLYRDWKAKVGNLLLGPGYLVFAYFILSLFVNVPIMFPLYSTSWYLMVVLSILMIERQVLRYIAVKNVYGRKSGFISSFFPPLLPFRLVLGNIINFHSTILAWKLRIFGAGPRIKKKPKWNKTEHSFLELEILERYKRNLGDVLLYQKLITPKKLKVALEEATDTCTRLGVVLIEKGFVSEEDVARSVCDVTQRIYVDRCPAGISRKYKNRYGRENLIEVKALPLFRFSGGLVIMTTIDGDQEKIRETLKEENLYFIYSTSKIILNCLQGPEASQIDEDFQAIENYLLQGVISIEQGVLAFMHGGIDVPLEETLGEMGLIVGYEDAIVERLKVFRGDEIPWDVRPQMAELFIKAYAPWITRLLEKKKRSFKIFSNIFVLNQFYVAVMGKKVLGMAASCQGGPLPIKIDFDYLENVLGGIIGRFALNNLKKQCDKLYKYCPIGKSSIVFYAAVPELKDRGVASRIRSYIMSQQEMSQKE